MSDSSPAILVISGALTAYFAYLFALKPKRVIAWIALKIFRNENMLASASGFFHVIISILFAGTGLLFIMAAVSLLS